MKDIDDINPKQNEDELIDKDLKLYENSEHIVATVDLFCALIDENNKSVLSQLYQSLKPLNALVQVDDSFEQYYKEYNAALISIKETLNFVHGYKDNIDFNIERIEALRERYVQLKKLVKKYGSLEVAINRRLDYEEELKQLMNADNLLEELREQIEDKRKQVCKLAVEISNIRKQTAIDLENNFSKEFDKIGLESAQLNIVFDTNTEVPNSQELYLDIDGKKVVVNEDGIDKVDYLISTNKGEPFSSIKSIASGGEISRIMLALKNVLAENDDVPILIFDEIDTGVSGRIAQKVGLSIKNLSQYHQVIAITHLPQIAAIGENFVLVYKEEKEGRVRSVARNLSEEERIFEVAKMMSGETVSTEAIENAKKLFM